MAAGGWWEAKLGAAIRDGCVGSRSRLLFAPENKKNNNKKVSVWTPGVMELFDRKMTNSSVCEHMWSALLQLFF